MLKHILTYKSKIFLIKMTYYSLPKSHNIIEINPLISYVDNVMTQTSHSLSKYYSDLRVQLVKYKKEDVDNIINKSMMVSNDFFFSRTKFSQETLNELKPITTLFYELLDVFLTLNISFSEKSIRCIHIGQNCLDSRKCLGLVRENSRDENHCFESIGEDIFNIMNEKRYDFIFYETTSSIGGGNNNYIIELLQYLMVLLKYQTAGGGCVIKIDQMFHKPVTDILYVLSCIYDKVSIIKPSTSNIISFDRFIICKNFLLNEKRKEAYRADYFKIGEFISDSKLINDYNISSVVDIDVPYLFLNRIDDVNIILGQQQLEHINQIINVLKSKNPDEKIESIKKANNQKSILSWSEKIKATSSSINTNIFLKQKIDDREKVDKEKNCFL